MENALTLARHFARLVWLLLREPDSVDEQKAALRAVLALSKDTAARLYLSEDRLMVNELEVPDALSGVQELVERFTTHHLARIDIARAAEAADVLGIARLLGARVAGEGEVLQNAVQIAAFGSPTVSVVRSAPVAPPLPQRPAAKVNLDAFAPGSSERTALQQLAAANDSQDASTLLDSLLFTAETALREGRVIDAGHVCAAMQEIEMQMTEIDVRRLFLVALRRLTRPNFLRPIAKLITDPERASLASRILERFGQDGVDAIVDQYVNSSTDTERQEYRDALSRMPGARAAVTQMLGDPRWFMVRYAVQLLGEIAPAECERAIAETFANTDERVRRETVRALARSDSAFAFDEISRALGDPAVSVRLASITALVARKSSKSAQLLSRAIDEEAETEVQFALLAGMGRIATPDSVQKLIKASEAGGGLFKSKKNNGLRVAAVQALAEARTPAATNTLRSLQSDRDREVAEAARLALASSRGTAA